MSGDTGAERKFECRTCKARFLRAHDLRAHGVKHRKKAFQCNKCETKFTYYHHLEAHKARGRGYCRKMSVKNSPTLQVSKQAQFRRKKNRENRKKCRFCYHTFSTYLRLREHYLEKCARFEPHVCNICFRKFMSRITLRRHQDELHGL
jgi:uncharacterized Zn-finger protein